MYKIFNTSWFLAFNGTNFITFGYIYIYIMLILSFSISCYSLYNILRDKQLRNNIILYIAEIVPRYFNIFYQIPVAS